MNYHQILDMLTNSIRSVNKTLNKKSGYGLGVTKLLNEKLGDPSSKIKMIHIAGTNGKGSVAAKISKSFTLAGYKVGLFSSPHLTTFRERIRINGEYISEESFARVVEKVFKCSLECSIEPIFFEILCLAALLYFAEEKVDVAVIEAGIGGRIDSTNFINPILSVITSIDYDHIPFLGDTLEDIEYHKAGIIKKNIPVVLAPSAQKKVILKEAQEKESQTIFACASGGFFDEENIDVAALSLKVLSKTFPKLTDEIICEGVKQRPNARFEVIPSFLAQRMCPEYKELPDFIVLDVAHNIGGIKAVFEAIKLKLSTQKVRVLLGSAKVKNQDAGYNFLAKHAEAVHVLPIKHIKLEDPLVIKQKLVDKGIQKVYFNPDLKNTLKEAFVLAKENQETVLICGSFFIMEDVRKALGFKDILDQMPKSLV